MSFLAYKGRIDRAPSAKDALRELSDIARQIEADRKLSAKDKLVLIEAVGARTRDLARIGGTG